MRTRPADCPQFQIRGASANRAKPWMENLHDTQRYIAVALGPKNIGCRRTGAGWKKSVYLTFVETALAGHPARKLWLVSSDRLVVHFATFVSLLPPERVFPAKRIPAYEMSLGTLVLRIQWRIWIIDRAYPKQVLIAELRHRSLAQRLQSLPPPPVARFSAFCVAAEVTSSGACFEGRTPNVPVQPPGEFRRNVELGARPFTRNASATPRSAARPSARTRDRAVPQKPVCRCGGVRALRL